ncbi:MAG: low molecular weight phosphotyrosine protein phosphatase [Clostridia bacterium]|nr:low molecular weight phosphotyrosine protein phosphatase [Clostridia bacterium]
MGNGVHHGTRRKLAEMGVPCGEHRAVQITKKDYDNYDYILIMDANNRRNLMRIIGADTEGKVHGLLDFSGRPRDIADPWYTGNFDVTYDDVVEGCETFLEHLRETGRI